MSSYLSNSIIALLLASTIIIFTLGFSVDVYDYNDVNVNQSFNTSYDQLDSIQDRAVNITDTVQSSPFSGFFTPTSNNVISMTVKLSFDVFNMTASIIKDSVNTFNIDPLFYGVIFTIGLIIIVVTVIALAFGRKEL